MNKQARSRLYLIELLSAVVLLTFNWPQTVLHAAELPESTTPSPHIFIGGEVKAPGRYPWTNGMTLTACIERAAGYTLYADLAHIKVTRAETNTLLFDYRSAAASSANNPTIQPGDSIFVRREPLREAVRSAGRKLNLDLKLPPMGQSRLLEVQGEVSHPGRFTWVTNMTLSILIAMAGGLTKDADPTHVRIYLQGAVETWDYTRATGSSTWDPPVPGGARIVVPRAEPDNHSPLLQQPTGK